MANFVRSKPHLLMCHALGGLLLVALTGCTGVVTSAQTRLVRSLSSAILNQDDILTVKQGAPAYLLLIDAMLQDDPSNPQLLLVGAKLYGAYAGAFVEDADRVRRLTTRARDYGRRALCHQNGQVCSVLRRPYEAFVAMLDAVTLADVPTFYGWATAELAWIQAHRDDWNAVAELPKVEAAMQRVIALDEAYDKGAAHLYLGILATLRPPALGGKPEIGKAHFERAITLSDGRDLMAKVQFAKYYARLVFDRDLHDRLLHEVLDASGKEPGRTLINALAKRAARRLLASSEDYF